jgi:hypothetical protein
MLMTHLVSVVVRDLDIKRVAVDEPEADAPSVVDRDRILALSMPGELVEPIPGGTRRSSMRLARSMYSTFRLARRMISGGSRLDRPVTRSS